VHVDFTLPLPEGSGCFASGTNGLAAGNHLAEALVSALCELIERDADALWLRSQTVGNARLLDLRSINDSLVCQVLSILEGAEIEIEIWDTTTDIGLPAFRCHVFETKHNPNAPQGVFFGSGCHPSKRIALLRALLEAIQSRLTYISGSRDDIDQRDYEERHLDRSIPSPKTSGTLFSDIKELDFLDVIEELKHALCRLMKVGIRHAVAIDLTQAEIGVPTVKVIVPGLEGLPDGPEYVPGPRARGICE
jgi:ribosomal protein S12 methylthiotransferase accessory factor